MLEPHSPTSERVIKHRNDPRMASVVNLRVVFGSGGGGFVVVNVGSHWSKAQEGLAPDQGRESTARVPVASMATPSRCRSSVLHFGTLTTPQLSLGAMQHR
eukprot:1393932-Amphidinium_carterae.2